MLVGFTVLLIGFSVLSAAALLVAYLLFLKGMRKTRTGLVSCAVLLVSIVGLQLAHFWHLQTGAEPLGLRWYALLLLLSPLSYFFFSRAVLMPDADLAPIHWIHAAPLAISFFLPTRLLVPVAFGIGVAYAFWFAFVVFRLRQQRTRFKFEMFFFGLFAALAVFALVLGLSIRIIDPHVFYIGYANFIGVAFLLIVTALIVFPELLSDITEAAEFAYAVSTLGNVDVEAALLRLDELMRVDKIYRNENLSLGLLAAELGLSSHQLSELINSRFGVGFSRFVRERRVAEARRLLAEDPRSSVLAISLMAGFRSQSNFYAAFREIVGEAPGSYRKKLRSSRRNS